ncbi:hypothetical protein DPMN_043061 [Dreissena polymorpha]|uniref:Uncharacterized protein n=1 Tax=Dreissena polymorpha TaxID=45954 RepID=A0A9D4HXK0_DREPO|nr:hypothetical protein DPMN_043061 [Dreissena polymorpha]
MKQMKIKLLQNQNHHPNHHQTDPKNNKLHQTSKQMKKKIQPFSDGQQETEENLSGKTHSKTVTKHLKIVKNSNRKQQSYS